MTANKIYEPIRKKLEEWIDYYDHEPDYLSNRKAYDEYRRWHDRDCVLTGGDLNADTMFSLWRPLANTLSRINDKNAIQNMMQEKRFTKIIVIRKLIEGDNMEKLLPVKKPIVGKLSILFELGMGRENVFLLPDRKLNPDRNQRPYDDYMPAFLLASFGDGKFAHYWQNEEDYIQWIKKEHLEMFFEGEIAPENIRDLSGAGDIRKSFAPDGIQPMERMIDHYISILQERRKCFTAEELKSAEIMNEMMRDDGRIQGFRDHIAEGDSGAVRQVKDLMGD